MPRNPPRRVGPGCSVVLPAGVHYGVGVVTVGWESVPLLGSTHWTAFLERSGMRPARLHDARHTAAALLLVWAVDRASSWTWFGWTSLGCPRGRTTAGPQPQIKATSTVTTCCESTGSSLASGRLAGLSLIHISEPTRL